MRWRRSSWLFLTLAILLAGAALILRSNRPAAEKIIAPPVTAGATATTPPPPAAVAATPPSPGPASTAPLPPSASTNAATASASATNRFPYRLSNTTEGISELMRQDRAVLLANAFIDTGRPADLPIPAHLRASGDPGAYVVQSRGPINDAFRAMLAGAGATIVSYIPNNAFLVRISAGGAQQLASNPLTQSVLPYEPYYKLAAPLLKTAVEQKPLPANDGLNLTLFADARAATLNALEKLGAHVISEQPSPFGPVVATQVPADSLAAVAGLPGVQGVDLVHRRKPANDLTRVRVGVSTNTVTATNYLGLTGSNILVNVNDTGVDATNVDLMPRVVANNPAALVDSEGHGTHVAGIIASSGINSTNIGTNASGSVEGANFRGKAPAARIFSQNINFTPGFSVSDAYLQETAAGTNALISNNSWGYVNDTSYDIASASYDAAVRDALPGVPGSQPLVYVFAAGNEGLGESGGTGGSANTISSPGTAKNVITVGAFELPRKITNEVFRPTSPACSTTFQTNAPFLGLTDSSNQVASFSSRGNVGIGTEGVYGRFKPDVIAPGTFVVSTRSQQWDTSAYYNPTNLSFNTHFDQIVETNSLNQYSTALVPCGAVQLIIYLWPSIDTPPSLITNVSIPGLANNVPMVNLPIYVRLGGKPTNNVFDVVRNGIVSIPPDLSLTTDVTYNYAVGNTFSNAVGFNVTTLLVTTNDFGNYFQVLSNLNNGLGPYYRYESGTSMSAPAVSGMLALMQEFFQQRVGVTNSPALMKALVINGARSVNSIYDMQVNNDINYQGWGRANLPTSLPAALLNAQSQAISPILIFDQDPTNALATGQSRTYKINLDAVAVEDSLRVTLAWTDPPGNPNAGVKLVNNLDLVVTNLDTGDVYVGNDIPALRVFNQSLDTNLPPNFDLVNNVENVYIEEAFGTNFSVTVIGQRVNVNAVTANTNSIAQDYALVISSGDGTNASAMTLSPPATVITTPTTNIVYVNSTNNGVALRSQFVGANFPLMVSTNGTTNQWQFYVVTNVDNFSNAAFVLIPPQTLSIPRMVDRYWNQYNSTHTGGDSDLYVSTNPALLYLDPVVLDASYQSRTRSASESVVLSNSFQGAVYYIGVESQRQEAEEFGFMGGFSEFPFAEGDLRRPLNKFPVVIPDGSPGNPGHIEIVFPQGTASDSPTVRRVVVTNSITHQLFGDLFVELSHDNDFAVLENHTFGDGTTNQTLIYEDNGEGGIPGSRTSDGPGSLRDFAGKDGTGAWFLTYVDNVAGATGQVNLAYVALESQNENGFSGILGGGEQAFFFVDVPPEATNLTIFLTNTLPLVLSVRRDDFPTDTVYDKTAVIPAPGGTLSISTRDFPPLQAGLYVIRVFNPNTVQVPYSISWLLGLAPVSPLTFTSSAPMPLLDDAVTNFTLNVPNNLGVARAEVGVRIDHPRVADLALTLISPRGTRVLLSENRGGLSTEGFGSSVSITNSIAVPSTGTNAPDTNVFNAGTNSGIVRIDYNFFTVEDWLEVDYQGAPIFGPQLLSEANTLYIPFSGTSSIVTIIVNGIPNTNTGTMWSYTATSIQSTHNYAVFTESVFDTNSPNSFFTPKLIKLAPPPPPFSIPNYTGTNAALSNGIYFQPEETLETLNGESPRGNWKLEVLDNRVGATNPTPTLVSWQLQLVLDRQVIPATQLMHGIPVTNTVGSNSVQYYYVDVPLCAQFATNSLVRATGPLDVWYGTNGLPTTTDTNDFLMLTATNNGSFVLSSNSVPPLVVGQRYYLAVTNSSAVDVTYTFLLEFDITTLSNNVPVTGVSPVGTQCYFQFDVSTNATAVTFALTNLSGNVSLIAKNDLPLPTFFDFDYGSFKSGSQDEFIVVFRDSVPVPLSAGRWYLAVINADVAPVNFTIVASEYTNALPSIITLSNNVPYFNVNSGTGDTNDYYHFIVSTNAIRVKFEILNPSSDMTLVARKGFPPLPDLSNYDYISTNGGASNELIVILPNSSPVPLTPGDWFLTAVNVSGAPATYYIKATEYSYPSEATIVGYQFTSSNLCLTWISVPGVRYFIQGTPSLNPMAWANVPPPITAVSSLTTGCVPLPSPYQFFRVVVDETPYTNALPTIVALTNAVPYFNSNSGTGSTSNFYYFEVSTNAIRARFEIINPSGNMTLVARKGFPPLPDLNTYDYISANGGSSNELIWVYTNSTPVPLSPGGWFLTALNVSGGPVNYAIQATEFNYGTNATITGYQVTGGSFCLTWSSVIGARYFVQGETSVFGPWTNVSPSIQAVTTQTNYCIPLPSAYQFFRVVTDESPPPALTVSISSIKVTTNGIVLQWTGPPSQQFQVQWSATLSPPTWNTFTNIVGSGTGSFTYTDDGSQSGGLGVRRFYRLISYP